MFGRRIGLFILTAALVFAVVPAAAATSAAGGGAEVSQGEFVTLEGGADLGYEIKGKAVMRRVPWGGGRTTVVVYVRGLDASTVYPAHVHNAPCSADPPGGSHYQHLIGGPVDAVNEIWPTVTTRAAGNGRGWATHGHWARADAQSIVIHYPANTSIRLACADLRGRPEVTKGAFVTLAGGADLGYEIKGKAVMRRVPWGDGRTTVVVYVRGLDASTVYPAHVHNAPCSADPPGGSHYQHEVGGAVDPINEIWPSVTTNAVASGRGWATHGHWARADAQSIVIHYPANTSIRLACADLS